MERIIGPDVADGSTIRRDDAQWAVGDSTHDGRTVCWDLNLHRPEQLDAVW